MQSCPWCSIILPAAVDATRSPFGRRLTDCNVLCSTLQDILVDEAAAPSLRQNVVLLHCNLSWEDDEPLAIHFPITLIAALPSPDEQLCRSRSVAQAVGNISSSSNSSSTVGTLANLSRQRDAQAVIDLSYKRDVLLLEDALTAPGVPVESASASSGSQPRPSSEPEPGALRMQNLLLAGLAQGQHAAAAVDLLSPYVWTILLWGIRRWVHELQAAVSLVH